MVYKSDVGFMEYGNNIPGTAEGLSTSSPIPGTAEGLSTSSPIPGTAEGLSTSSPIPGTAEGLSGNGSGYTHSGNGTAAGGDFPGMTQGTMPPMPHAVTTAGSNSYIYDENGNMVSARGGGLLKDFTYDAENRLIEVNNAGLVTTFQYNHAGKRIKKTTRDRIITYVGNLYEVISDGANVTKTVKHIFAGQNRIATVETIPGTSEGLSTYSDIPGTSEGLSTYSDIPGTAEGLSTSSPIPGTSEGLSSSSDIPGTAEGLSGNVIWYYHPDHLGSSNVITDQDGNLRAYFEYTPYGKTARDDRPINPESRATDYRFTGKELDNTGLYYYGARYYDPEIGRFITPDSFVSNPLDPQTLNRYTYCRNNPLIYIDPSGNFFVAMIIGAIIGAIIGGAVAAVTGGDIGQGILWGAVGGALTGGISQALGSAVYGSAEAFAGASTLAKATIYSVSAFASTAIVGAMQGVNSSHLWRSAFISAGVAFASTMIIGSISEAAKNQRAA